MITRQKQKQMKTIANEGLDGESNRRTKVTKFFMGDENFVRPKFVQNYFCPIRYVLSGHDGFI